VNLPPEVPIVIAASASWETPAPVNVHQVARRLAERGHRVLFFESTGLRAPSLGSGQDRTRILARLRALGARPREVAPRLWVASPWPLPPIGPAWLRSWFQRRSAAAAARTARRLGFGSAVLWAFLPTALALADRLSPRLLVYHCVDDYGANPGVDRSWLDAIERRMVARADVVFATSPVLGARLESCAPRRPVRVVPNVADVALFRRALDPQPEPAALVGRARPRAVYVGNLAAYRIDFSLLQAVVDAGIELVLIGAVGLGDTSALPADASRLLASGRVVSIGAQPHGVLASHLAHCDVGLIPFLVNDHTRGSMPLKLWEYLAAGLPVVATDLPNLRGAAAGDAAGMLRLASSADAFAAEVTAAAAEPAARRADRSRAATPHDWPARMNELCTAVGGALASRETARTVAEESG